MKRNKLSTKAMRRRNREQSGELGNSRYARKVRSGKQMYGPGCCANALARQSLGRQS